jgi:chromosome segregation ATPase
MALQKQVTMSEDHIQEKDEVLQVSRELEQIKVEFAESLQDRDEIAEDLKKRDQIIDDNKNRIDNLEKAIDKQLGKEEELESSLRQSEEEIEKLLDEIQNFERKLESGESVDGGVSFVELRNTKKNLVEKEKTVTSQKLLIEELEKELKDSLTVPQLQIEELDQENKGLQGRLKGERLEYTSKLSSRDEIISNLKTKLAGYTASSDALDLQSARQKLNEAREDATTVREDLIAARKVIENLHGDREDLTEKYTLLKENSAFMEKSMKELNEKSDNLRDKVLEWTEKTYNWKQKAESAERKLEACNEEKSVDDNGEPIESENFVDAAPQGLLLHAAMEKGKRNSAVSSRSSSWGIFKNSSENQELTAEEIRIRILEEQNHDFEAKVSELNSELVRMQTAHKEELYTTKKKIAQLEGENEALTLQNSTLEQLRET